MWSETLSLMELAARFLDQQRAARHAGVLETPGFEVEPHEAWAGSHVEPRTAWEHAVFALHLLNDGESAFRCQAVPGWSQLVLVRPSVQALPMACGNFPQLVRDLPSLMRRESTSESCSSPIDFASRSVLVAWADRVVNERRFPEALLAVGITRLAADYGRAEQYLTALDTSVPPGWRVAFENERATLEWQQGDIQGATSRWNQLPERVPILFNRGLSYLFQNQSDKARPLLERVAAAVPEDNAWHQLANFYSALSRMNP
jgi:tetratricopeptide (TPR) repeat protein